MDDLHVTLSVDPTDTSADLRQELERCGCRVEVAVRRPGGEAEASLQVKRPLLLSVAKGGAGDLAWCRDLRRRHPDLRICVLFEEADETIVVVALEMGADAVLRRPVGARYLTAQLRALARRIDPARRGHDGVELRRGAREAWLDGQRLALTDSEYDLLLLLATHPGRVLDRDGIRREIRGLPHDHRDRSIDLAVVRLRRKLGDDPHRPRFIKTVRGEGYMFMDSGA